MSSCQCQGLESETQKWVLEDLALYRKGKPARTTPLLINALVSRGSRRCPCSTLAGALA